MNFQLSSNGRIPLANGRNLLANGRNPLANDRNPLVSRLFPLASRSLMRPNRLVGHATRGASAVRVSRLGSSQLCAALAAAMVLTALLSVTPAAEAQRTITVGSPITVTLDSPASVITEPASALRAGDAVPEISWLEQAIILSRRLGAGETVTVPLTFTGNTTGDGLPDATRDMDYELRCDNVPGNVTCAGLGTTTVTVTITGPTENFPLGGVTAAVLRVVAKHDTDAESMGERAKLVLGSASGQLTVKQGSQTITRSISVSSMDEAESFIVLDRLAFTTNDPALVKLDISPEDRNKPEGSSFTLKASVEHNNAQVRVREDFVIPLEISGARFHRLQSEIAPANELDYGVPKSIKIARGTFEGSATLVYADDSVDEIRKIFSLRVGDDLPTGYKRHGDASTLRQFIIFDNDPTVVTLSRAAGVTVEEGSTVDYRLSLSRQLGARVVGGAFEAESLTVPLTFNSGANAATLGTDFTLACSTATGVTCAGLGTANPKVTFAGSSPTDDLENRLVRSANSVTITLTATPDDDAEPSGELVDIGLGAPEDLAIADDGQARATDNAAVLRIIDPSPPVTDSTDPNPNPNQPSSGTPSGGSSGSSTRVTPTTTTTVPSAVVFTDLDETFAVHRDAVDALVKDGVFDRLGCATNRLCPDQTINRWRLAVIMVRRLDGTANPPGITRSLFSDVSASSWWSRYVQRLSRLEITKGCATEPLRYCPDDPLTRAQAASFIARAYELTSSTDPGFVDIEGSVHEADINAMYAAGITKGCATEPLRYCPDKPLTLQEFATMLHRAKQ